MPLEFFIALRYLKARRRGVFTLLTTLIAVGGITLGVAALIITLSVMTGFHRDIQDKILSIQPHLIVIKDDRLPFTEYANVISRLRSLPGVKAAAPFVYGQILIRHADATIGSVVKGISLNDEAAVVRLRDVLLPPGGELRTLGDRDILLGKELALNLGARAGDEVILMSPGTGMMLPRMEKYRVAALFHSGMFEYDSSLAYVSLAAAQKLFDIDSTVTGIGASVADSDQAGRTETIAQAALGYPYRVRSWEQMNHSLFAALKLEKIMMFIILTLIILVAAFTVISNLLLLTVEKAREIGILSAIGLPRTAIARIFFFEGALIGAAGTLFGAGLGVSVSLILERFHFIHLPPDVYYLDTLPVRIVYGDVGLVIASTLLITLAAAVYPAWQVSRMDPLDAIRIG